MWHQDPTCRGLLLQLAEPDPPDLAALPLLADWLEERGDERAAKIRKLRVNRIPIRGQPANSVIGHGYVVNPPDPSKNTCLYPDQQAAVAHLVRRVLELFPEGPRWRCNSVSRREGETGLALTLMAPHRNNFLTRQEAEAAARSPLGYALPVEGPEWASSAAS